LQKVQQYCNNQEKSKKLDSETGESSFFMCAQHGQQLGGESPLRAW
jgi:hypothetical protein